MITQWVFLKCYSCVQIWRPWCAKVPFYWLFESIFPSCGLIFFRWDVGSDFMSGWSLLCSFTHVLMVVVMMMMVGLAGSTRGWPFILVPGKPFQKNVRGKKTWQEEKGFIIAICNSNYYYFGQYTEYRKTRAIFYCNGTFFKKGSTRFIVINQAPHALTSQMFFLQKGKKMSIFSYFCPCLYLHILEIKIFISSCFALV